LRRFEEAIGCYQQALAILPVTGDCYVEGVTPGSLGLAYWEIEAA
jgi:hypothetical protein